MKLHVPMTILISLLLLSATRAESPIQVWMLGGSSGSHRPTQMAPLLATPLGQRGITIRYSENSSELATLDPNSTPVAIIFKDDGEISPDEEKGLIQFVESGGGLVAIHCASHAFRNSPQYGALVGGRFLSHGNGTFPVKIIDAQHQITRGLKAFDATDETYIHNELNRDNRVIMVRDEAGGYEPYSWWRTQGKGRVFYTALGHDEKTWNDPNFQNLIERAIRWAARNSPDEEPEYELPEDYLAHPPTEPLSPEASMRRMHMPEGFSVSLFAAEPQIARPITMAFDDRGRVWVVESTNYPNEVLNPEKGADKIKICEDTDGDGLADKFTVFADGLNIPTAILPVSDGAIVGLAPYIMHFRDSDEDGVSDKRDVLYAGFGRSDTHAVLSNFRPGADGWIYATVGYSAGVVEVGDVKHRLSAGVFRFKPDGSGFEVLTPTESNTWGLGFDESGNLFISKANDAHSLLLAIPNRFYEQVRGWSGAGNEMIADHKHFHPVTRHIRQVDWFDGYTAAAGQTVYTARSFPKEFWNRTAFVCEPTGHLIHTDFLVPKGSSFVARDGYNLLASSDPWCAPIEAHVGPDGAVWFLDWYNYIVRHNPTPAGFETGKGNAYVTDQRDYVRGRIYRITYGDSSANEEPELATADLTSLVTALEHRNLYWSDRAREELLQRASTARDEVRTLVAEAIKRDGMNRFMLVKQGLWILQRTETSNEPSQELGVAILVGLMSDDPAVRRTTIAVMPRTAELRDSILDADLLADSDPFVRRDALLALAEMPGSPRTATALAAFATTPNSTDRWTLDALTSAASKSDFDFLSNILGHGPTDDAIIANASKVTKIISSHWSRGQVDSDQFATLAKSMRDSRSSPAIAGAMIEGWSEAKATKLPLDENSERALADLLPRLDASAQMKLAALAHDWKATGALGDGVKNQRTSLESKLADVAAPDAERISAARLLARIASDDLAIDAILSRITPQTSPELASGWIDALSERDSAAVGTKLASAWPALSPSIRNTAFEVLSRRTEWTLALVTAISDTSIPSGDLNIEQRQRLLGHPDQKISDLARTALTSSSAASNEDREAILARLLPLAKQHGDKSRGAEVFEKNCVQCHTFNGKGNKVGPELTGIAARTREEILTDVLDPNRSVEGNYRQWIVETNNNIMLTGRLARESRTTVELLDAQGQPHTLERASLKELRQSKLSMMPEGFEDLPPEDIASLLDYLTERGKYLQLPLQRAATAVSTRGMFTDKGNDIERLIFPQWGMQTAFGIPFFVLDPQNDKVNNAILLYGPNGNVCRSMPKQAVVPCHARVNVVHILGGVAGWAHPIGTTGSVSLIIRLKYCDGSTEDHPLLNGIHMADYISVNEVPESKLAFKLRNQQLRYLSITPKRTDEISEIELIKGDDQTAPVVMAITVELAE